jgi:hypothetical protein
MSKELPYIDENNQLHYEAYFGGGNFRSFLRESFPLDHPEHLYNYLQRHGIDWKLFFNENGSRKGNEHGPMSPLEKLMGKARNKGLQLYTEEDMEAAFNGGGANAAKERVSGNKLTLPVLDFNQWMDKYKTAQKICRSVAPEPDNIPLFDSEYNSKYIRMQGIKKKP